MTTEPMIETGALSFDRRTDPRTAHTEGRCTLDGRVWAGEGYKELREW